MSLRRLLRCFLLSWALMLAGGEAAARALPATEPACVKSVAWHHSPPYGFMDAKGQLRGIDIELMGLLLQRLGCAARFAEMPVQRAMLELEAGRLDLRPSTAHSAERERFARFSRSIEDHPNRVFVATPALARWPQRQLAELADTDFRLAVQASAVYGPEFDALRREPGFAARLQAVSSVQVAWRMLLAGRVDGVITDDLSAEQLSNELGRPGAASATAIKLHTAPSAIAMSRVSVDAAFAERLDAALVQMRASGELKALYERHGMCEHEGRRRSCGR